jgi:hypothetical protein
METAARSAAPSDGSPGVRSAEHHLPSLFGRLTNFLDARERHTRILEKVREMAEAIDAGQSPLPAALDPGPLLLELRWELAMHFAAEESDLHFGTIAREQPALLPRVVDLKADHAAMLEDLLQLETIAHTPARWGELPASVARFVAAFHEHEHSETELVAQFLSR